MAVPGSFTCSLGTITPTSIYVSWTASSGATHYVVVGGASSSGNITSTNFTLTYSPARYAPDGQVVSVTAYNADGNRSATGSPMSASFPAAPGGSAPGNVPPFSGSVGETSMSVNWSAASGATSYNYWLFRGSTQVDSGNQTSRSYSRSGLVSGASHTFIVEGKNDYGTSPSATTWDFTTTSSVSPPGTPGTPSFSNITSTSVECTWGSASGADSYDWQLLIGGNVQASGSNNTNRYLFFSGLLASTTYTLRVWGRNAAGLSANYSSASFTTLGGARPANWTWTSAELTAFDGNGNFNTLTASRWNEFLNRINAFAQYKGISLMSSQLERTSGQPLTAFIFNTVCSKINEIPGASLALDPYRNRVTGNTVMGSYFKTMASELNKIT